MTCSANTKDPDNKTQRCYRKIGHGGLHCYIWKNTYLIEFPDSQAWFPHYQLVSKQDIPK